MLRAVTWWRAGTGPSHGPGGILTRIPRSPALRFLAVLLLPASVFVAIGVLVAATGPRPPSPRYNSDEHHLIVDQGVALVKVPASVTFPTSVTFAPIAASAYIDQIRQAKLLAVGFDSNNESDYDQTRGKVQDNCYWNHYGQLEYNKKIHIPDAANVPSKVLKVLGYTSGTSAAGLTMGQLAAIYGDYRRTTYCAGGKCYLTDGDVGDIGFGRGNVVRKGTFCPDPLLAGRYLAAIASGLVPPFGSAGNEFANTANDDEWTDAGWWGDEMLRIANVNDWHFSSGAIAWYVGLHRLALLYADSARSNPAHWTRALHYEANALHAFTDLFAFGHVVTNRDVTTMGILAADKLTGNAGHLWMENVLRMGGATRAGDGRISLSSNLPAIADRAGVRNDFVKSDRGTWAKRADWERRYHDEFNTSGAQVRNLRGDEFTILGDSHLNDMMATGNAMAVLTGGVRASVQALFDAYESMRTGTATAADLGKAGSPYFVALQYLPVYVGQDANRYFLGRWTLYAKAIDEMAGTAKVPGTWDNCKVAYLSGADGLSWPDKQSSACAAFDGGN